MIRLKKFNSQFPIGGDSGAAILMIYYGNDGCPSEYAVCGIFKGSEGITSPTYCYASRWDTIAEFFNIELKTFK